MARNVDQALWERWRQRIERQRESRLSIAEFCRREGVSQAGFHAWKRKLGRSRSASPSSHPSARRRLRMAGGHDAVRRDPAPQHALTNAVATARPANFLQLPVLGSRAAPWIDVMLVDGTIIRVPQQNLAALHTVLQVLRGEHAKGLVGEVSHA